MADIGNRNKLRVVRETAPGIYLDGGIHQDILLPKRYVAPGTAVGAELDVFVYRDSEDRLVATTEVPLVTVGECAFLKVVNIRSGVGAFLDWGLSKDLLLPIREQMRPVTTGERVVVYVYLDPLTGRIVATTRLLTHLDRTPPPFSEGQAVRLMIAGETPLGYRAVVANTHTGLLYHTDLNIALKTGQQLSGYIQTIRPDGKIDLCLNPTGHQRIVPLAQQIMKALEANGGRLDFDDKSSPEAIRDKFATSKKAFKQAIGSLFRERLISFENGGIRLVPPSAGR